MWKMDFREQEQKQALSDAVALVHSFFTGFHPYHSPVREADLAEPPTTNEAETQRRDSQNLARISIDTSCLFIKLLDSSKKWKAPELSGGA